MIYDDFRLVSGGLVVKSSLFALIFAILFSQGFCLKQVWWGVNSANAAETSTKNESSKAKKTNEIDDRELLKKRIAELETKVSEQSLEIEQLKEKERQKRAGNSVTPTGVSYSDPGGAVTVEILKIFTGEQVVTNHKLHAFELQSMREQGKEPIYFEVKVTNSKFNGELNVNIYGFKLESDRGETFSTQQTRDYLTGSIHQGRSATGGIAYAIYPNSKPKLLRYKPGLRNILGELEIVSPDLQQILPNSNYK